MRKSVFGKHLYNQIAVPLVLAALAVGIIATVIAVYFLSTLTDQWVDSTAEAATAHLEQRLNAVSSDMQSTARLISGDERLRRALLDGDFATARGIVAQTSVILGADDVILLDGAGMAVAASGRADIEPGDMVLATDQRSFTEINMAHPILLELDGVFTLTALQPISVGDEVFTVAVSNEMDDAFLSDLAGGAGDAYCFYDADAQRVACSLTPGDIDPDAYDVLQAELHDSNPEIQAALEDAESGKPGIATIDSGGGTYRAWARQLYLEDDPLGEPAGYLVSIVSQAVTAEAERTTTQLIIMWSIIAILSLVGLGVWVARRVSAPLAELAEGATRVADGDFSTRIEVSGANEIADLADAFNQMTESLKERSESLTKKVLELATLYEMSRALGSTLEMSVLLESVLDSALKIFDLDLGYVTVREKETDQLDLVAWRAPGDDRPDEKALRSSMAEWVIREGRPLIFNPTEDAGDSQIDTVSGALAALCVPLTATEGSIGAISVGSHDADFRFNSDDVRLLSTIANHATIAIGNIELFSSLQEAYLATVRSLAAAVDAKDAFTRGHSDKVAAYAIMIGEGLGLSHEQRVALEMAAYLHDIGKIGIKEEILLKPGKLSDAEMAQMSHHPLIGANILKPVGFPWPITPIVRHHHERWDGDGYPAGLKGEEIPLLARVLTVADAFEAMTADRPYRAARSLDEGLQELVRCSGSQFDSRIVTAFEEVMQESPMFDENIELDDLGDVDPEEAQAIFVAVAEGMLDSFRKLGGPRLAANVEKDLTGACRRAGIPVSVAAGRVESQVGEIEDPATQLVVMRETLRIFDETMSRMSGTTLVEHFYSDALSGLSGRMQRIAEGLEFNLR